MDEGEDHAPRRRSLAIDPASYAVTRIDVPHLPSGVAATDDDVWVAVHGE